MRNELTTIAQSVIEDALTAAGHDPARFSGFDGARAVFESQGLDLSGKLAIERAIVKALADATAPGGLLVGKVSDEEKQSNWPPVIYFRKQANASGDLAQGKSGPAPAAPRGIGPFGVKRDLRAIPGVKHVVLVASGKGGVGKSTVSANLAVALAKDFRVGLLDADIYGPSSQMLLGLSGSLPVTGDNKLLPLEGHGVKVVSFGFLTDAAQPVIWRGPMASKALEQFFYDVDWGELDYLVVDMPPGTGDVQLTFMEKLPVAGAIIVTTPQDVALIDAKKALSMFRKLDVNVLGAVENMSAFHCPSCGHEEHIFGKDSFTTFLREHELALLAQIPLRKEIRLRSDEGKPVARAAEAALATPWQELAAAVKTSLPPEIATSPDRP